MFYAIEWTAFENSQRFVLITQRYIAAQKPSFIWRIKYLFFKKILPFSTILSILRRVF